jgi:hypothetical protein
MRVYVSARRRNSPTALRVLSYLRLEAHAAVTADTLPNAHHSDRDDHGRLGYSWSEQVFLSQLALSGAEAPIDLERPAARNRSVVHTRHHRPPCLPSAGSEAGSHSSASSA